MTVRFSPEKGEVLDTQHDAYWEICTRLLVLWKVLKYR